MQIWTRQLYERTNIVIEHFMLNGEEKGSPTVAMVTIAKYIEVV